MYFPWKMPVTAIAVLAGASVDWKTMVASGCGAFFAVIAHRTVARADWRKDIEAALLKHERACMCPHRTLTPVPNKDV